MCVPTSSSVDTAITHAISIYLYPIYRGWNTSQDQIGLDLLMKVFNSCYVALEHFCRNQFCLIFRLRFYEYWALLERLCNLY